MPSVATALTSVAIGVETLSSPVEQGARKTLNCDIVSSNASADENYRSLQAMYQQQKKQNDELLRQTETQNDAIRQQYEALRKNYASLEMRYQEESEQTGMLQQQYEDLKKRYQEFVGHL